MKKVDARGMLCPKPLIVTRKALKEGHGRFEVILDNDTAFENVSRFLKDNALAFESRCAGGEYHLSVTGADGEPAGPCAENCCPPAGAHTAENIDSGAFVRPADKSAQPPSKSQSDYVLVFKRDVMGEGPEELGRILIQGFTAAIQEMETLPGAIALYNKGVFLACRESPLAESLGKLETLGVKIMVCGACVDYFEIKKDLAVGTISNMFEIAETLTRAGHLVSP